MKRFTLYYRGELKSNGDAEHKHKIRSVFHPQVERAWKQSELFQTIESEKTELSHEDYLNKESVKRSEFRFIPLLTEGTVELEVTLLRPGPLGYIISGGGDIDNRLKTVFDALQIPDENQVKNLMSSYKPDPFHCVMRDDKMVSHVSVKTAQFLEVPDNSKEVVLVINVTHDGPLVYLHKGAHFIGNS